MRVTIFGGLEQKKIIFFHFFEFGRFRHSIIGKTPISTESADFRN